MIDLHSHILPAIDDGARHLDDTLLLAKQAVEQGVTHMVCTPHVHVGRFDNSREIIANAFNDTLECLQAQNVNLKLSYASEVRTCIEITQWHQSGALCYLGQWKDKKALLLEMPHSHVPTGIERLIHWLLQQNVQPIIPHPERNRDILAQPDKALWLKRMGVVFQATAGAFTGTFGEQVEHLAWQMLEENLIAYVASDMHNLNKRPNEMAQAYKIIAEKHSEHRATDLFVTTPLHITRDTLWQ
uniref:tyrosine-protein phosphatase n=1 Tax=Ningiella ruwaisensis TaxID=2364274 RepID=UPI0010A06745|nr:CpsB/CapC family capsule biosynthesis tyrosine phosphatase [Ningiella ruwaisensis]